jgi:NADH dehydrogenase/NADH:ubiquinone oxidoreductase subunit G
MAYPKNQAEHHINKSTKWLAENLWGQSVSLLDYCLNLGIFIPHFCYHKHLSIAGNCRMCLVELKKYPKPIVSCAMNAKSTLLGVNTEIFTNSPLVKKARENVLEFLLLNHPLDCPICDQGGVCDLQDQSLFFGFTKKRFYKYKRVVTDKNLGLIVKTVMTRCIHCTRCVRFASEIAGVEELGIFGRGINSEIGTYVNTVFQSELSGNIVDLCPVGALTLKPYPFVGRNWELIRIHTIDLSDSYCTNIQVFLKNNKIVKVLSSFGHLSTDNPNLWISDKTRFLFDSTFSANRDVAELDTEKEKTNDLLWTGLFVKLVALFYLFDHLTNHNNTYNNFLTVFGENNSVEVISILLVLEKKHPFFCIRRSVKIKILNDFQVSYRVNALKNSYLLASSNTCMFLGTNTRFENPYYNLKFKKRYSMGNFRAFSICSKTSLTFPSISIGSNTKKLSSIVEGNDNTGFSFQKSNNLLAVSNTEVLFRHDSYGLLNLLQKLNAFCSQNIWNTFNILNNSINSVGIGNLHSFKNITYTDLIKNNGVFLVNSSLTVLDILKKSFDLVFLNCKGSVAVRAVLIEQNYQSRLSKTQFIYT